MALFDLPETRESKEKVKAIAKKSTSPTSPKHSVKAQNTLSLKLQLLKDKIVLKNPNRLITDYATALEWVNSVSDGSIVFIDTETTGTTPMVNHVIGICLASIEKDEPVYIPFGHVDINDVLLPGQLTHNQAKDIFVRLMNKTVGCYHYAKFDLRMLKNTFNLDRYPTIMWDTFIAGHLLNENEPHGLKELWNKYCKTDKSTSTYSELFDGIPFEKVPLDIAAEYGANDALMTRDLYLFQKPYLDGESHKCIEQDLVDTSKLYHDIELPLISIVAEMEDTGILVDQDFAKTLQNSYSEMLNNISARCADATNKLLDKCDLPMDKASKLDSPINIGSPAQLAILLYDGLKLESPDKSKPRGTGEDIISKLSEKVPELKVVLEYREISKLLSTYINTIPNSVLFDGRIHTGFNQMGAKTGRFSSSEPVNMQNIPKHNKDIRKMFVASPGHVLISADFSQQEPRVLTTISKDKVMIKAYSENKDIYASIGSYVFNVPYEQCLEKNADGTPNKEGEKRRSKMKALVLAKMYGNGDRAVAESLKISVEEAKEIAQVFNKQIPGAQWAADYHKQMAREKGYVKTVYGRKRRLPDVNLPEYEIYREKEPVDSEEYAYFVGKLNLAWGNDKRRIIQELKNEFGINIVDNGGKIADAERQAMNSPIQGSAADITKKAMVAVAHSDKLRRLGYKLLFPVHDELVGECPIENYKEVVKEKCRLMIECCTDKISVPMKVDVDISERWTGEPLET